MPFYFLHLHRVKGIDGWFYTISSFIAFEWLVSVIHCLLCPNGGIGRRAGLKHLWETVPVRLRLRVQKPLRNQGFFCLYAESNIFFCSGFGYKNLWEIRGFFVFTRSQIFFFAPASGTKTSENLDRPKKASIFLGNLQRLYLFKENYCIVNYWWKWLKRVVYKS